jgi:hypothetical protein
LGSSSIPTIGRCAAAAGVDGIFKDSPNAASTQWPLNKFYDLLKNMKTTIHDQVLKFEN